MFSMYAITLVSVAPFLERLALEFSMVIVGVLLGSHRVGLEDLLKEMKIKDDSFSEEVEGFMSQGSKSSSFNQNIYVSNVVWYFLMSFSLGSSL
jgi:hypothetical protein